MSSSKYLTVLWFSVTGFLIAFFATRFGYLLPQTEYYFYIITAGISGALTGLFIQYREKNKERIAVSFIKLIFVGFYYTLLGYLVECLFLAIFYSYQLGHSHQLGGNHFFGVFFYIVLLVPLGVLTAGGGWIAFIGGPLSFVLFKSLKSQKYS